MLGQRSAKLIHRVANENNELISYSNQPINVMLSKVNIEPIINDALADREAYRLTCVISNHSNIQKGDKLMVGEDTYIIKSKRPLSVLNSINVSYFIEAEF